MKLEGRSLSKEEWAIIISQLSQTKGRRYNLGVLLRACKVQWLNAEDLSLEFQNVIWSTRFAEEMDIPFARKAVLDVVRQITSLPKGMTLGIWPVPDQGVYERAMKRVPFPDA